MTTQRRDPDRLYNLLPAMYRIADAGQGEPLRALLALIDEQAGAVQDDIQQLWDNYFIETSQSWVVPYIGDLVGSSPLHDPDLASAAAIAEELFPDLQGPDLRPPSVVRTRADVANTISYRRRKGTPAMLEDLARDVTGWDARVVEFLTLLSWTQHLEHVRHDSHGCASLRRVDDGDRAAGPWDTLPHAVDVRSISPLEGWYNIQNIGFFLWRLAAFPHTKVTPRQIGDTPWRRTLSPLGNDQPLFSSGMRPPDGSGLANELSVAAPIRAAAFFEDLRSTPPGTTVSGYYDEPDAGGSLMLYLDGAPVSRQQITCADLSRWADYPSQPTGTTLFIDPVRGRIVIPQGIDPNLVTASWFGGFSAAMGAGEYDKSKWMVHPSTEDPLTGGTVALQDRLDARASDKRTVIEIGDSATYTLTSPLLLEADESLTIQATSSGAVPHIQIAGGTLVIRTAGEGATLTLSGLLIEGNIHVEGDPDRLRLLHTTLVPGTSILQELSPPIVGPSLVVEPQNGDDVINSRLEVQIAFSIVGAIRLPSHLAKLWLLDSIVHGIEEPDGPVGAAISDHSGTNGPTAHIERSTIIGESHFLKLPMASESIFTATVLVRQLQDGCVRFCYLPDGSSTPRPYRCQPQLEIAARIEQRRRSAMYSGTTLPPGWEDPIRAGVLDWLVPEFESLRYSDPDYAQLGINCPAQIRTGAEDASEMGAFCTLKQPQRERNLKIRLDEYLPIGLNAGIIYVTRDH